MCNSDLFFLLTCAKESKNYGYAFINHLNIIHFVHLFNGKKWNGTNSEKICEIVYSEHQGVTKLTKHFQLKEQRQKEIKDKSAADNANKDSTSDPKDKRRSLTIAVPKVYKEISKRFIPT